MTGSGNGFALLDGLAADGTNGVTRVAILGAGCFLRIAELGLVSFRGDYSALLDGLAADGTDKVTRVAVLGAGCLLCVADFGLVSSLRDDRTGFHQFIAICAINITGIAVLGAGCCFCIADFGMLVRAFGRFRSRLCRTGQAVEEELMQLRHLCSRHLGAVREHIEVHGLDTIAQLSRVPGSVAGCVERDILVGAAEEGCRNRIDVISDHVCRKSKLTIDIYLQIRTGEHFHKLDIPGRSDTCAYGNVLQIGIQYRRNLAGSKIVLDGEVIVGLARLRQKRDADRHVLRIGNVRNVQDGDLGITAGRSLQSRGLVQPSGTALRQVVGGRTVSSGTCDILVCRDRGGINDLLQSRSGHPIHLHDHGIGHIDIVIDRTVHGFDTVARIHVGGLVARDIEVQILVFAAHEELACIRIRGIFRTERKHAVDVHLQLIHGEDFHKFHRTGNLDRILFKNVLVNTERRHKTGTKVICHTYVKVIVTRAADGCRSDCNQRTGSIQFIRDLDHRNLCLGGKRLTSHILTGSMDLDVGQTALLGIVKGEIGSLAHHAVVIHRRGERLDFDRLHLFTGLTGSELGAVFGHGRLLGDRPCTPLMSGCRNNAGRGFATHGTISHLDTGLGTGRLQCAFALIAPCTPVVDMRLFQRCRDLCSRSGQFLDRTGIRNTGKALLKREHCTVCIINIGSGVAVVMVLLCGRMICNVKSVLALTAAGHLEI